MAEESWKQGLEYQLMLGVSAQLFRSLLAESHTTPERVKQGAEASTLIRLTYFYVYWKI